MVEKTKAYIAGFLDGDGSIFLQLVPRKGYRLGYQVRASVVFYQKTSQKMILRWLKHKLRMGYLRDRNDNLSEYTIVGLREVAVVLKELLPYLLIKRKQAKLALRIISKLEEVSSIDSKMLLKIATEVDKFKDLNYSKKRVNTAAKIKEFLKNQNLVPVSTDLRQELRLDVVR